MSSLFPRGDSLVCMIDDRDDVWEYAPNLVQVKPYTWFKDVGDINAMYLPSLTETNEEKHQQGKKRKCFQESDELSEKLTTSNNSDVTVDTDIYLHQLEIILKRIHKTFYANYDQRIQGKHEVMPDLKQIMPEIRRQILISVSLCFSGLMPQNYSVEKHRATMMAQAMGAKVTYDLHIDSNYTNRTTHVIAGKQTMKVHQALQNNIKVVTPEWLIDCYEQWEKKKEENYILTSEYDIQKSRLCTLEIPRVSKRSYSDMQQEAPRKRSQINDSSLSNKIALKRFQ
jgi:RNA polymerase II subunit A-like phosphatase